MSCTPLTSIPGFAETLLDSALEDRNNNRRFVEIISRMPYVFRTHNGLADTGDAGVESFQLVPETIDLAAVVHEVVEASDRCDSPNAGT
jgi:signal transduction histidine kinase